MQEETASDPAIPSKMDGIASIFGGKIVILQKGSDESKLISGVKEPFALQHEEPSLLSEDLARRLAARRLAVDQAINECKENPNQTTFPRSKTKSNQLIAVINKPRSIDST